MEYKYIKIPDFNKEPHSIIEHSNIMCKLNTVLRKKKIKNIISNFNQFIKENKKDINESLGINKEVSDFCNDLFDIIKDDIRDNIKERKVNILNNIGIKNIEIVYHYANSNDVATVKKDENNNILLLIYVNNISNLLSNINHEFLHIYSELKGHISSEYYHSLIVLANKYPSTDSWLGILVYILYFYTEYEMNANIQELWKEIENQNIRDVKSFDNYAENHKFYTNNKYIETIDLKKIWNNIEKDYMSNILIKALDIKDISKWLLKTEKELKQKSDKFKRRIFRLRNLFDKKNI